jgi:prepilin-type N-terminal cleavage/methylation domain-containing protein
VTRPPSGCRGLTLIELVLTMTILSLVGVLVSGGLAAGLRAWRGDAVGNREELVARIVLERLAAQLRSAVPSPAKIQGEDAVAFDAGEHAVRFVTIAGGGAAPMQVSYRVERSASGEGEELVYREYPWPDKDFFGTSRPRREERVAEVTGLAVTVTPRTEELETGEQTAAAWNPRDQELPDRVTLEVTVGPAAGGEPRRYRVVVPILMHSSQ